MKTTQIAPSGIDHELHRSPFKSSNRMWIIILIVFTVVVAIGIIVVLVVVLTDADKTGPMPQIQAEYQERANKIIQYCTVGGGKGKAYEWVANISDTFGNRKIGSEALERAIDHNVDQFKNEYGLQNVHTENASLPIWIRGEEEAYMISPRYKKLAILGLGSTVGTNGNLTADAVVVTSWDDLNARCNLSVNQGGVKDRIVVFNQPWEGSYGKSSNYRGGGATAASKCGAVAALIRSASSISINSPHTGQQYYADDVQKIPAISITTEDAELMHRIQLRGQPLKIRLYVTSRNDDSHELISRNTIFELRGSTHPNEIVLLNGHFDSWDVGSGAMDNGAGASIALRAIVNLKQMIDQGLLPAPKRTIRGILWTAEEPGMLGSGAYYRSHINDTDPDRYVFLQEADEGFFLPMALIFSGSPESKITFQNQIFPMLDGMNLTVGTGSLGDSDWWAREGIPGVMLASTGAGYQRYFAFHHSEGDTPTVYGKNDLDNPTAIWAVLAYVIADMNQTLPIGQRPQEAHRISDGL